MLTIRIELLNHCYAACPWDTAHVEGIVEIPPSPWRIYRAFFAGFFAAKNAGEGVKIENLESVIAILARTLPSYYIPPSAYVQTRTYRRDRTDDLNLHKPGKIMVLGELRFNPTDCTIYIFWDVELTQRQEELLSICLKFCAYLGIRECDAVWQIESQDLSLANCHPDLNGGLKTLVPGADFEPQHLLNSPREIFDLQKRQFVPGAKWTSYSLTTDERITSNDRQSRKFNYVKVALIADFPLLANNVLFFSEKLHSSLVQKCPSANFTGCDRAKNYLRSNHHAYLIPVIQRGKIIAFEIYCANGFSSEEEQAFFVLKKLYFKKSKPVSLKIVAMGHLSDYASPAKVWHSTTPMFLPRYPATLRGKVRMLKKSIYQKDGAEHQALKLLLHLPQFESLKSRDIDYQPTGFGLEQWIDGELFCQARTKIFDRYWLWKCDRVRAKKAVAQGYEVRLSFSQPQLAPIAIGSAAHFGLGAFASSDESAGSADNLVQSSLILDSS